MGLVDTQDYSPCVADPSLLDLGSPHSHLHRSQHSLRLRIYFKPAASLHNGKQVPPAGTVCFKYSVRIGLNFKHDVSCLQVDLAQKAQ